MMKKMLPISQMSYLCGISRRTLLHYDAIDVFKPKHIAPNSYRFYASEQLPALMEICFLTSVGIMLKEIQRHFINRSVEQEMLLLQKQQQELDEQRLLLNKKQNAIAQRLQEYQQCLEADSLQPGIPFLALVPARRILFAPYPQPLNVENMQLVGLELWRDFYQKERIPSTSLGSVFVQKNVLLHQPLLDSGHCLLLAADDTSFTQSLFRPEYQCACLYQAALPTDTNAIEVLLHWIGNNGYELCGDILAVRLLDTTFYSNDNTLNLYRFEAPVRTKL